jgi:hypothetical protein
MPRTTRKVLLVPLLAAAALLGAGCATTVQGSPAATGGTPAAADTGGGAPAATSDPVAWSDQVCGVLLTFSEGPGSEPPEVDPTAPEKAVEEFTAYLDKAIGTTDTALEGLQAAGPAPMAGGDAFVQKMSDNLNTVKDFFTTAKTGFENYDPNDPTSLLDALGGSAGGPEGLEDLESPGEALKASPELAAAAEQAPKCKELTSA